VDVRIGVSNTAKEIDIELGDDVNPESLQKTISKVLSGGDDVLWLTDKKGRTVGVPSSKLAYIEIGAEGAGRRIGFVG
jgi:3-deoxy-D-manno-octulosonic acid (KDO) 8-phosphate synthase